MVLVTLTYPHEYPEDPDRCKGHLKALRKRLQREYGRFAAFWRLGIQKRGAWHFHLLLFRGSSFGLICDLRRFISRSWYEITGRVSEEHLRAGTRVGAAKKWKQATSNAERYLAKPEEFPKGMQPGRIWGCRTSNFFPCGGRGSRSASRTPTRSGGYTGSWRGGRAAALCPARRCS
jgi:hypothetical protein